MKKVVKKPVGKTVSAPVQKKVKKEPKSLKLVKKIPSAEALNRAKKKK